MRRALAASLSVALAATAPRAATADGGTAESAALRSAARSATDDARALVLEHADAGYARRDAITQALVAMDDRAVAALVVAKRSASPGTRVWAKDTLEAMGRERADEQIRTRDPDVLVGILRAFGECRDPDALGVLSSFVGSERASAREAARAALLDYGDTARTKIRQDFADLTGAPAPPAWTTEQVARALFAASDHSRLREVYALLDDGLARADAGDVDAAVADFDAVLARQGELVNGKDAARVYVAYAIGLEDADAAAARAYLEKATRLSGDPPSSEAASELAYLEGRALEARGVPADETYRRALTLDPSNPRARAALERIGASALARQSRWTRWTWQACAALALLVLAVLFIGRRRQAGT